MWSPFRTVNKPSSSRRKTTRTQQGPYPKGLDLNDRFTLKQDVKDLPPDSSMEDDSPESLKSSDSDLTEPKIPDDEFSITKPINPTMASKAPELKIGTPSALDGNTDNTA
ncbi:hypothetical protein BS17DRAFT_770022 [Gyrodon lividus]|nr:hypothetical protein BS17DRAFT_770022 [Gyrodon lividus]